MRPLAWPRPGCGCAGASGPGHSGGSEEPRRLLPPVMRRRVGFYVSAMLISVIFCCRRGNCADRARLALPDQVCRACWKAASAKTGALICRAVPGLTGAKPGPWVAACACVVSRSATGQWDEILRVFSFCIDIIRAGGILNLSEANTLAHGRDACALSRRPGGARLQAEEEALTDPLTACFTPPGRCGLESATFSETLYRCRVFLCQIFRCGIFRAGPGLNPRQRTGAILTCLVRQRGQVRKTGRTGSCGPDQLDGPDRNGGRLPGLVLQPSIRLPMMAMAC